MRTYGRRLRRARWLVAGGAIALGASIATAAPRGGQNSPASQGTTVQNDDDLATIGETTTQDTCANQCHGFDSLVQRRTADDWNNVIKEMVDRGAVATDKDFAIVRRYLTRYYGLVAVNTAKAEELSAVLGLSPKDAKAIVDYRTAHGKFADAAALARVPEIDTHRIDAQPDALRFK